MIKTKKLYFENLDALRFFAAMFVVFHHIGLHLVNAESPWGHYLQVLLTFNYNAGFIGVSFFFVLSGFLITYLMFYELEKTSDFNIPHFYLRRFLRIWPLYFASLVIGFVLVPFFSGLWGDGYREGSNPIMYSLFLANFDNIYSASPSTGILGVQWSVAIEEQFYLFWPLVFALFARGKRFLLVLLGFISLSFFYRAFHDQNKAIVQFHTLSALNELSVGGLLAFFSFHHKQYSDRFFKHLNRWTTTIVYLVGFMFLFFKFEVSQTPAMNYLYRLVASLFFGFIILEQTFSLKSVFKVGRIRQFTSVGRVSYGLYLLHMVPVIMVLGFRKMFYVPLIIEVVVVIGFSIALSHMSYRYYESRFLVLKKRVSHVRTGGV